MEKLTTIKAEFVQTMPNNLEHGKIYVSEVYSTAIHLCACGCGRETVTPLNDTGWQFARNIDGNISLMPSIGNFGFPCHSHYLITDGKINWL